MNDLNNYRWVYNGKNMEKYSYDLRFSEYSNGITFHHFCSDGFGSTYSGVYEKEQNNVIVYFSQNCKWKYDGEYSKVEGPISAITITLEINKIADNIIIVKQITGNNIFVNQDLNTEMKFKAKKYKKPDKKHG